MNRECYSCLYVDPDVDPHAHASYILGLMGQQCEAKPDNLESGSESIQMEHLRIVTQNLKKKRKKIKQIILD